MTGPETDTGIVERALAVLAQECAAWTAAPHPAEAEPDPVIPGGRP